MSPIARDLLAAFDALSAEEQHEVAAEILRRSYGSGERFCRRPCTNWRTSCSAAMTPRRPRVPRPNRGEVWLADLGMAAKVRPGLVLSVPPDPQDRVLVTLVPHTTSVQGTRFEVAVPKPFLKAGVFDAQGLATVAPARLLRKLGLLNPVEVALVEKSVRHWLGL